MKNSRNRLARCSFCANSCPLNAPKCSRGEKLAGEKGIYETAAQKQPSRLRQWLQLKFGLDKNRYI